MFRTPNQNNIPHFYNAICTIRSTVQRVFLKFTFFIPVKAFDTIRVGTFKKLFQGFKTSCWKFGLRIPGTCALANPRISQAKIYNYFVTIDRRVLYVCAAQSCGNSVITRYVAIDSRVVCI